MLAVRDTVRTRCECLSLFVYASFDILYVQMASNLLDVSQKYYTGTIYDKLFLPPCHLAPVAILHCCCCYVLLRVACSFEHIVGFWDLGYKHINDHRIMSSLLV